MRSVPNPDCRVRKGSPVKIRRSREGGNPARGSHPPILGKAAGLFILSLSKDIVNRVMARWLPNPRPAKSPLILSLSKDTPNEVNLDDK